MKSVGEAMAIGRSFPEALQKALRSVEQRGASFSWDGAARAHGRQVDAFVEPAKHPHRRAHRRGAAGAARRRHRGAAPRGHRDRPLVPRPDAPHRGGGREAGRRAGDARLARLLAHRQARTASPTPSSRSCGAWARREAQVRALRHRLGVRPVFKTVDTCAAEFAATTPYHYSAYERDARRGGALRPPQGRRPRLRPEPHRAGRRVRLLLRPRRLRPARRRLRGGAWSTATPRPSPPTTTPPTASTSSR